jgi:hypothetical protein
MHMHLLCIAWQRTSFRLPSDLLPTSDRVGDEIVPCSIPEDDEWIIKMLGDRKSWNRVKKEVLTAWKKDGKGNLVNSGLLRSYEDAMASRESKRTGAYARWQGNRDGNSDANASATASASHDANASDGMQMHGSRIASISSSSIYIKTKHDVLADEKPKPQIKTEDLKPEQDILRWMEAQWDRHNKTKNKFERLPWPRHLAVAEKFPMAEKDVGALEFRRKWIDYLETSPKPHPLGFIAQFGVLSRSYVKKTPKPVVRPVESKTFEEELAAMEKFIGRPK